MTQGWGSAVPRVLMPTCGHPAHVFAITSLYVPVLVGSISAHRPYTVWVCVYVLGRDGSGV